MYLRLSKEGCLRLFFFPRVSLIINCCCFYSEHHSFHVWKAKKGKLKESQEISSVFHLSLWKYAFLSCSKKSSIPSSSLPSSRQHHIKTIEVVLPPLLFSLSNQSIIFSFTLLGFVDCSSTEARELSEATKICILALSFNGSDFESIISLYVVHFR